MKNDLQNLLDNILNITNTVCQVIVAIAAIIAIIITLKQIQSKKKSNLGVSYKFGMGAVRYANQSTEIIIGITIHIRNVGLGPVYYDNCGIEFVHGSKFFHKNNPGIIMSSCLKKNMVTIKPGESIYESTSNLDEILEEINYKNNILNEDRVYIYVELCNGKTLRWNTGDNYIQFIEKFSKIKHKKEGTKNLSKHKP